MVQLYDIEGACKVVFAGCILHNFCVLSGDELEDFMEAGDDGHPNNYGPVALDGNVGIQLRNRLLNQLI
jgi:hypothetical protein